MARVPHQPRKIFILSPASCSGQRAALLFNERAQFFLARRLREQGAPVGEVFSFLSGLYFRGKLTYARGFSGAQATSGGIWMITAGRGLVDPETIVRLDDLRAFAAVPIDATEITINLKHEGRGEQFKLAALADQGDPAGKSSRFVSTDVELAQDLDHEGAEPQLVMTVNGKPYRGAIEHEHGHEGEHSQDDGHAH